MPKTHRKGSHVVADSCSWADPWAIIPIPSATLHEDDAKQRCAECTVDRAEYNPTHRLITVGYCTYHETTHYDGHESGVCRIVVKVLS